MYTEVEYGEFKTSKLIADTFINLGIELKTRPIKTIPTPCTNIKPIIPNKKSALYSINLT